MKRNLLNGLRVSTWAILFAALTLISSGVFAQDYRIDFNTGKNALSVTENNLQTLRINYVFGGLQSVEVKTEKGNFNELILPEGYSVGELGAPKLPAVKNLIEIPFGAEVSVKVKSYTVTDYKLADYGLNFPVMPAQPSIRKDWNEDEIPFEYNLQAYQKNEFSRSDIASLEVLGVMRGVRVGRLDISPVKYNPATGTIRVYNNLEVEISFNGSDKALTEYIKASTYSPYFEAPYGKILNSQKDYPAHPDLTKYPVKMIVVANRMFEADLQPYFEWKTKKGFILDVAYTDVIGTSATQIKNHIYGLYNAATPEDPAPSFVVIVGDSAQVFPSAYGSASGGVTDLYYGSVDGDIFPEMYVGRFPVQTVQQLNNMIEKILYYEKYEFEDPTFLDKATLIAGEDGTWNPRVGQPTVHYGTQNYWNAANGFTTVNAYLNSYSGVYDPDRIAVSFINFTAHCSPTSWAGPTLTPAMVHAFTNTGKYPLAVGNCCQSSQFSVNESIGEAWVRAAQKGAIGYIGSVPSTYWFEDFYWAVGAFPIVGTNNGYVPTFAETSLGAHDAGFVSNYVSIAALNFVGNLAVSEAHTQSYQTHSNPTYYWQAYQIFGDPSLVVYNTQADDNVVSHMAIMPKGVTTYTVNALPGSYVAISKDGVLHGAALVDESGEVEVIIVPILDDGNVDIVVTKPQRKPYMVQVPAAALVGPYIVLDSYVVNDSQGNNNGLIDYTETLTLDMVAKNVGADPATTVTATITINDPYVTLIGSNTMTFGAIQAGTNNTATVTNALTLQVAADVPNQYKPTFAMVFTDGTTEWNANLKLTINAPVLALAANYTMDDTQGNSNGRLDPGETAVITFKIHNNGHATANAPQAMLVGDCAYLTITAPEDAIEPIAAGSFAEVSYIVEAHAACPEGLNTVLNFTASEVSEVEANYTLIIGQMPQVIIGTGNQQASNYPFYNYYKANRSQMLYLESELGAGDKTITELGFDLSYITPTPEHRSLPNFKIIVKPTTATSLSGAFTNTSDGIVVFQAATYTMPSATGWHMWDVTDFVLPAGQNLIVEVIWGLLPSYCANGQNFKVNGSQVANQRVVFGYSDTQASPSYNNSSNVLPNLFVKFAAQETGDEFTVNFKVVSGSIDNPVENAVVLIGSKELVTDAQGNTSISLYPGEFIYHVDAENFDPLLFQSFELVDENLTIIVDLTFNPTYLVTFEVVNIWDGVVSDAVLTFNTQAHNAGVYQVSGVEPGTYTWQVNHAHYVEKTGSVEVNDNITVQIVLDPNGLFVEANIKPAVTAFPNPTTGIVMVNTRGFASGMNITLMNYQGQTIANETLTNTSSARFDLSGYAKGIYYVKVSDSKNVEVLRIVVQ